MAENKAKMKMKQMVRDELMVTSAVLGKRLGVYILKKRLKSIRKNVIGLICYKQMHALHGKGLESACAQISSVENLYEDLIQRDNDYWYNLLKGQKAEIIIGQKIAHDILTSDVIIK
ncbi:hypothetical protein HCJ57_16390 [Listeria booriae]|uniref:hypothetical protein n=1 Tax=Listeria booriae TaxID=1552123 RepID=UPI0016252CDD|nr:hypothetical protein [Listeria booriae]MBC1433717.1 hypothetical protein [Listeria welshimeri]MBC2058096.1 hypothetical protein [Listeria booriae]MBC2069414.1 hypothetical protein [Listeria booriae]